MLWNRRDWLRVGAVSCAAPILARGSETTTPKSGWGRARSVLLVFAHGGQSQLDMWDPKPNAPLDIRGAFQPIATSIPGVHFCEHLPQVAKLAKEFAVVRSMSHEDLDHGSAVYLALTGHYHTRRSSNPPPSALDQPTLGAVLRRARPTERFLFDAVHLNGPALVPTTPSPGQDGGFLGRSVEPLLVGDPTLGAAAFPGLDLTEAVSADRLHGRLALKQRLDQVLGHWDANQQTGDLTRLYGEAARMLLSAKVRDAFALDREPAPLRDRYGRHRSGQSLLLARRLIEADVPFVQVTWNHTNRGQDTQPDTTDEYGWDTHNDIFDALKRRLLPRFDQSFSALLEDLTNRGLLATTLVICMGEFGRAPRVALEPNFAGATPGRKHWASVYSLVMAGAGVRGGTIVGASDRWGGEPRSERYGPWDVAATLFHSLGVDPNSHFSDSTGRTFPVATGRPIGALFG